MAKASQAALGFRVKSGWAAAVLLIGPSDAPEALDRRVVDLCDPELAETKQPYHAAMGLLEQDADKIKRRTKLVRRAAADSVTALLTDHRAAGHRIRGAGLVVGSLSDPSSIANPHIRAHALEGQLFRSVLADALRDDGLEVTTFLEVDMWDKASRLLARPADKLKQTVAGMGRALGSPWRAEEKLAAVAAWMVLV